MTEEEKKAATAKAEAEKAEKEKADAEANADAENESEEESDDAHSQETDFEERLKEEKQRADAAEAKLNETRKKAREKALEREEKRKEAAGESEEENEEEKPLTASELQAMLEQDRQKTTKELQADRIREIAGELAGSEAEASLIVEIHKNRTFPNSLSLKEQLEEAHAIANRKKLVSKNAELARALRSKGSAGHDSAGEHRDGLQGTEPKLPPTSPLKQYTFDKGSGHYFKKLKSGATMWVNPKAKPGQRKNWTVNK